MQRNCVYLRLRSIEDKDFIISPNSIKNIIMLSNLSKIKDLIVKFFFSKQLYNLSYG